MSDVTKSVPDVSAAFLSIMAALATGPKGAAYILLQFRQNASHPELEHFTWRALFKSVMEYCGSYMKVRMHGVVIARSNGDS